MTEDELVEALARRLQAVFGNRQWTVKERDRVARECLRQMEWARRDVIAELDRGRNNPIVAMAFVNHPLTLAPEDWKP